MTSVKDTGYYESQRTPGGAAQSSLQVPRTVLEAVGVHGEETYPHECCGVLLGTFTEGAVVVAKVIRSVNTRTDTAQNRYGINPMDIIHAQREGRAGDLEIVGFYHSHPDHPAFPSATDLVEAHWYGCSYVITSVDGTGDTPKAYETNSFVLIGSSENDKSLRSQPIVVV